MPFPFSGQEIPHDLTPLDSLGRISGEPNLVPIGQMGSSSDYFSLMGQIVPGRIVSASGLSPASTGGDYVLAAVPLPANLFDSALGRSLDVNVFGSFAANVNTKTIKIFIGATSPVVGSLISGGTLIASGSASTSAAGGGWSFGANIFSVSAGVQLAVHQSFQSGNAVGALQAPTAVAIAAGAVSNIVITGNAASATTDIVLNVLQLIGAN